MGRNKDGRKPDFFHLAFHHHSRLLSVTNVYSNLIICSFTVSLTSGIIQQRRLSRGADLLLPHDSELRDQLETMYRSFPFAFRDSSILFVQKDILKTDKIQRMAEMDKK